MQVSFDPPTPVAAPGVFQALPTQGVGAMYVDTAESSSGVPVGDPELHAYAQSRVSPAGGPGGGGADVGGPADEEVDRPETNSTPC